jgi:hypothetical protein
LNKDLLEDEDRTNAEPIFRMRQSGLVSVNFWDNQTLVLANLKMSSVTTNNQALNESKFMPIAGNPRGAKDKTLFIFITATIVDPAGNRAHSDEELSFTQKGPPPQPR